ncbi:MULTISPECIES: hypothetical protein [unclassified Microcoleus]|uniref:hypothetical protein n=1 Tax=unclassified Microcoleus TaxID=2642155 RepID=UPI002FD04674
MTAQRISVINLLRDTFAVVGSIYPALLRINYPHLIYFVVNTFGRYAMLNSLDITTHELDSASIYWHIIYWFVAVPFFWGATTFYTYRSLTGNQVTASDALTQAKRRLLPLIVVCFLSVVLLILSVAGTMWFLRFFAFVGLIRLIIIYPGLYVSCRLIFSSYATVIDNYSVQDSLKSSWKLTKGLWWLVFQSNLLILFVFFVPAVLLSGLIGSKWENLLGSQLLGNVLGLIAGLLMNVYLVLLYQRLRESAAATQ